MERHLDVKWEDVEKRLDEKTLKILANMEEPDTIGYDNDEMKKKMKMEKRIN